MKTVLKLFFVFLITLFLSNAVYAEKMPIKYNGGFNIKDNPIAYPYFEGYAKKLYEAFDTKKLWMLPMGYGVDINWILHKDGSVSDITPEWNDDKIPLSYKYGMSIIEKNPTPPFPKGLDEESIKINIFFCKDNFDRITLNYYPLEKEISIDIFKNHKIKKHKTPKVQLPFKNNY